MGWLGGWRATSAVQKRWNPRLQVPADRTATPRLLAAGLEGALGGNWVSQE